MALIRACMHNDSCAAIRMGRSLKMGMTMDKEPEAAAAPSNEMATNGKGSLDFHVLGKGIVPPSAPSCRHNDPLAMINLHSQLG
ncbi:hypothetical protein ACET3Z_007293 [Daucus carota]